MPGRGVAGLTAAYAAVSGRCPAAPVRAVAERRARPGQGVPVQCLINKKGVVFV
jgi:hypothetical protein